MAQDDLALAAQSFVLRTTGAETMSALERQLDDHYTACDAIITQALAPYDGPEDEA